MQDANLERYLEAAKIVADHAVVGAGPVDSFASRAKAGSRCRRSAALRTIDTKFGFRTVSGEGGFSFGLERYTKALFAAWEFQHRAALGEPNVTVASFGGARRQSRRASRSIF